MSTNQTLRAKLRQALAAHFNRVQLLLSPYREIRGEKAVNMRFSYSSRKRCPKIEPATGKIASGR